MFYKTTHRNLLKPALGLILALGIFATMTGCGGSEHPHGEADTPAHSADDHLNDVHLMPADSDFAAGIEEPVSPQVRVRERPPPYTRAHAGERPADSPLHVLLLGDSGGHQPAERAKQLIPVLLDRGIHVIYTEDVDRALSRATLDRYDALLVYANIESISDSQADALLGYVADGGGFVPIHSASYSFRNNAEVVALIGGQFQYHGPIRSFRTRFAEPDHPILQGLEPIESEDEPYEHRLHNEENRTVLSYRDDEPYTWVRTHGEGRVFYTAWGHDHRTWRQPGFHDLVERGIRWSAGQDVQEAIAARSIERPFEYVEQQVVYYPPGRGSRGDGDWNEMQLPLSPEESMTRALVPAGFELQLFASDPDIRKPITMAWDERGRLWIAETIDYPNELRPAGEGRDRLTVLEDTTGDGKADTFTVFAENLSIPTGIAFANGGVLIYHAPDTLFLKDTTGDGKADLKEVVFTGWGTGDTHAQASNLRYGIDNWYWGAHGYSGFRGEVNGEQHQFSSGLHRFRGDGSALELVRNTNNNTWGLGFGEDGLVFGSTANARPSVFMPIHRRYYEGVEGVNASVLPGLTTTPRFLPIRDRIRQVDVHGGYTAAAGHALYTARTWPKEYWNRIAFVTDATGHLAGEFSLVPDGAGFRAVNHTNILVSDDEWFAPIMAEVGPDGHLWVIDWYNYIIQHNPTPAGHRAGRGNAYETELRDQRHGRIYRIVYKGAEPQEPFSLHEASVEKLLATLDHDNLLWRKHAQRLLVERGETDVVPALIDLVRNREVDEIGLNPGAVHALWTLHGLGVLNGSNAEALSAANAALRHPSPAVRRNAAAVLPPTGQTEHALLSANVLEDEDAQVRLAALQALSDVPPSSMAGNAIYRIHDNSGNLGDPIIEDALVIAAVRHQHGFLTAARADGRLDPVDDEEPQEGPNLLANPSIENVSNGEAPGWSPLNHSGQSEYAVVPEGRVNGHALRISSNTGGDSSFITQVDVKPRTDYRLSGWVRTEDVRGARGALFNVHGFPQEEGATSGVSGTRDWQYVERIINSGDNTRLGINALFGGWGQSTGTAWFDDVSLVEILDSGNRNRVINFVVQNTSEFVDGAEIVPAGFEDATVINLGVIPDVMLFDKEELVVQAGERVRLIFSNPDHMPHNVLFIEPGSLEAIGAAADAMLVDPQAEAKHYVPDSPAVWAWTPVINPEETYELYFTAPETPGRYPFVCTFPGHWRIMQGILIVE